MVIDFHTHIFPKRIADKTMDQFKKMRGELSFDHSKLRFDTDGTLEGLKESMAKSSIDFSVVLPVATKPSQFEAINRHAAHINGEEGIISFGGIHPDTENYKSELEQIKNLRLLGVKLHPDYQGTLIDDRNYVNIVEYAAKLDLIVSVHAGNTFGFSKVHSTPKRIRNLIEMLEFNHGKIIIAHAGGYCLWNDAEKYLIGQNIMFDISSCFGHMEDAQLERIIKKHGADRVLFASDSPWESQPETLDSLKRLNLTDVELEQILFINGAKLLKLV